MPLVIDKKPPAASMGNVAYAAADLADTGEVTAAVESLADRVDGRITGVFTAAGIDSCGTLEQVPAKEREQVVAVNLIGTAAVIRAALPYLKATDGRIVTCASTLGVKAVIPHGHRRLPALSGPPWRADLHDGASAVRPVGVDRNPLRTRRRDPAAAGGVPPSRSAPS